jgi:hypothetical protein
VGKKEHLFSKQIKCVLQTQTNLLVTQWFTHHLVVCFSLLLLMNNPGEQFVSQNCVCLAKRANEELEGSSVVQ